MRRPRVRNVEERFERRVLPLFARKSKKVADLIPELYLHGLAEGDFDLALRGLLGDEARVSASTVARLKEKWHAELAEWRQRPLDDLEVVYMWVDGVYVKAGLEKEKAAHPGGAVLSSSLWVCHGATSAVWWTRRRDETTYNKDAPGGGVPVPWGVLRPSGLPLG